MKLNISKFSNAMGSDELKIDLEGNDVKIKTVKDLDIPKIEANTGGTVIILNIITK